MRRHIANPVKNHSFSQRQAVPDPGEH